MSILLDHVTAPNKPAATSQAKQVHERLEKPLLSAQGVRCGYRALAFPFDWATQIIEQFDLSPIPKSPPWLLGATSIGGLIVPVADLARYFDPDLSSNLTADTAIGFNSDSQTNFAPLQVASISGNLNKRRLLLGGAGNTSQNTKNQENTLALCFDGLPQVIKYKSDELEASTITSSLLRACSLGLARHSSGQPYHVIDTITLVDALLDQLSFE